MNTPTARAANPQPLPEARPVAYLVWHHTQRCRCCNSFHEWTQLILKSEIPARFGLGKPVTQMKVVSAFEWKLPIEHRSSTLHGIPEVPVCHECISAHSDLTDHLPLPPQADTRILKPVGLYGVQSSPTPERSPKATARATPARVRSADELLAELE